MGPNGNPGKILDASEVLEEITEEVDGMVSSLVPEHRRISIRELLCEDMYEPCTQNLNNDETALHSTRHLCRIAMTALGH